MAGKVVNKTELAAIIGRDVKTITIWQGEGMPYVAAQGAGNAPNSYNTVNVIRWMIDREAHGGLNLEDERAKLAAEQRRTAELRNAKLDGTQIDLEAASSVAQRAAFAIRQRILGSSLPEAEKKTLLADIHALAETDFTDAADENDEEDTEDDGDTNKKAG